MPYTFQPSRRNAFMVARPNRMSGGQAAAATGVGAGAAAGVATAVAVPGAMMAVGGGLSATGVGAVIGVPMLAAGGIALGVERLIRTKEEKLKAAIKNVAKYGINYQKCAGIKKKAGKGVYPADSRTGLLANNCHKDYKKWKDAQRLVAENAAATRTKLAGKGTLTATMEQDLTMMEELPAVTTAEERRKDKDRRKKKHKKNGKSDREAEALANAEMEEVDYAGEEEGSALPWIIGGGLVLALGVGGFVLYKRSA